ncbi:MAG: trehalose-6-phosphate synthase [Candidatus Krumholzibacteria bacterium]|nr:trehalose-6-phosphate synthase [Candidatus Krumholzibacteria bacterium]
MNNFIKRLVIISNRLPFTLKKRGKKWNIKPGSGGLVTALAPVLKNRDGLWIGWPGTSGIEDISEPLEIASRDVGYSMKPVLLSREEVQQYYIGLSNEVIWPLFHDLQSYCNFEPSYWETYKAVNKKFARVTADNTGPDDFIWVHDYHLMNVAQELRRLQVKSKVGFYLHIPFPPLDIFLKFPWRSEILSALLEFDLIGLQTLRDRRNFIQCLRAFNEGMSVQGKGQVLNVTLDGRDVRVGSFPISIDYKELAEMAKSKAVADKAWYIHEDLPMGQIILGIDRLDYTKGIRYRLKAFGKALELHPDMRGRVTLVQVVVPSRRKIPMYRDIKVKIERLVSEINGRFTRSGWVPIHYIYRSLTRTELLAYYRTAEIALVTPLKDGMNLVSKEYCAASIEENGVLILSEFAGAAAQLHKSAVMVNPYNIDGVSEAIYRAYTMKEEERKTKMKKLRQSIRRQDVYWWVNSYLHAAIAGTLENFPLTEEYTPCREVL